MLVLVIFGVLLMLIGVICYLIYLNVNRGSTFRDLKLYPGLKKFGLGILFVGLLWVLSVFTIKGLVTNTSLFTQNPIMQQSKQDSSGSTSQSDNSGSDSSSQGEQSSKIENQTPYNGSEAQNNVRQFNYQRLTDARLQTALAHKSYKLSGSVVASKVLKIDGASGNGALVQQGKNYYAVVMPNGTEAPMKKVLDVKGVLTGQLIQWNNDDNNSQKNINNARQGTDNGNPYIPVIVATETEVH